ncbi:MAG: S41 family peptidase, partial [Spirochaetia bacterium]|nr:S41 family peptidase [Spirochaetia bacterium]
ADGKIGYIRLSHFFGSDSGITDQFRKLLVSFKKEKVSGIVVDLRNNAGGHLDMAVEISGYFLKKGDLVVTAKGRNSSNNKIYKAKGKTKVVPENIPVAVLINQGSASASEILAGALQDHKRAKLIGNRSFGKGSVQQIVRPLPDDTAALITIQKYFTPKDRSIHGKGLEPDIKIDPILPTEDDRYYHSKMIKSSFFQKFKKEHPVYDTRLKKIFLESAKQAGYHFTEPFALVLLKNSYPDEKKGLTDSETDVQLAAAVRELLQN